MRKILSGFLATSMIVAMASTVSFAAVEKPSIAVTMADVKVGKTDGTADNTQTITGAAGQTLKSGTDSWNATVDIKGAVITLRDSSKVLGTINVPDFSVEGKGAVTAADASANLTVTFKAMTIDKADIANALNNKTFSGVVVDNKVYSGKFVASGDDLKVEFNESAAISGLATASLSGTVSLKSVSSAAALSGNGVITPLTIADVVLDKTAYTAAFKAASNQPGTGTESADVEISGDFFKSLGLKNVVWCDGNGNPVPMTEKGSGVDKDLNGSDGVQSDRTLYFMINDSVVSTFKDDNMWKIKASKGDNGKIIKAITDTTKIFSAPLVNANDGETIKDIVFTERHRYLKVELNELYTDDEYKVTLDLRLTPTSRAETKYNISGDEIKVKDFSFWVKNIEKSADSDWRVGLSGLMLKPVTNDWNNVTYHDEESDVAFVRFFGDSDVGKFYAKLSTKWTHDDYAAYFNDQDAFYFEFTGSPKLSTTSRADLQIYNPFTDEDGNSTFDAATATIYQIVDGDLVDVTSSFTFGEGENGEDAFIARTRFLGSYIICEKPVDEAVGNEDIDDLMPDEEEIPVAPETPDNNAGGKNPANTGRYA